MQSLLWLQTTPSILHKHWYPQHSCYSKFSIFEALSREWNRLWYRSRDPCLASRSNKVLKQRNIWDYFTSVKWKASTSKCRTHTKVSLEIRNAEQIKYFTFNKYLEQNYHQESWISRNILRNISLLKLITINL